MERGQLQGIPREPSREDARDKDDLVRQECERDRGLVGLSQAVRSRRQEENSVTTLASGGGLRWNRLPPLRGDRQWQLSLPLCLWCSVFAASRPYPELNNPTAASSVGSNNKRARKIIPARPVRLNTTYA